MLLSMSQETFVEKRKSRLTTQQAIVCQSKVYVSCVYVCPVCVCLCVSSVHVREWALARNICEQIVYVPPSLLPKNQKHACHITFVGCLQYLPLPPPPLSLSDCSIQILLKCRFDWLWCLAQVRVTVTVTKCFMARALMWLSDKHSTMQHLPMKVVHSGSGLGSGLGLGLGLCMCIYTYKGRGSLIWLHFAATWKSGKCCEPLLMQFLTN